jgi:hypothetical protein
VRDHGGQALAYVYFEDEPGRQSALYLLGIGAGALRGERYRRSGGALVLFAGTKEILARANTHDHERDWRHVVADRRIRGYAIYLYAVLAGSALGGQAAHQGRGAADGGKYRQAAGTIEPA